MPSLVDNVDIDGWVNEIAEQEAPALGKYAEPKKTSRLDRLRKGSRQLASGAAAAVSKPTSSLPPSGHEAGAIEKATGEVVKFYHTAQLPLVLGPSDDGQRTVVTAIQGQRRRSLEGLASSLFGMGGSHKQDALEELFMMVQQALVVHGRLRRGPSVIVPL
jgi:hypothetical protein